QLAGRIPGEAQGGGVEYAGLDVPPILIRLAAVEARAFQLPVPPGDARRDHAEADMRGIEPVVADRRLRRIQAREAVHEGRRAEVRLAWQAAIDEEAPLVAEPDAVARR